jgi:hypothetical protein
VLDRDRNAARNLAALVGHRRHVLPELRGDGKRARCKPCTRPTPCEQRVPPREGPRGQRRAARRRLPEQSELTSASGNGQHQTGFFRWRSAFRSTRPRAGIAERVLACARSVGVSAGQSATPNPPHQR